MANNKGLSGIGLVHSLGERELCVGSSDTLWCDQNDCLSGSASVMGSALLLELLVQAASLFFPHGFHGDFYPLMGVCLSGLLELVTFIFLSNSQS